MKIGLETLIAQDFRQLEGKRVGLMTNPSAVDRNLRSTYEIFTTSQQVNLVALYGPEHGFIGAAKDGETINSQVDPRTGIPIHSLYGETFRPTREMLEGVDILVCDIQDVGARYYTYLWTISYILEACGEYDVEVMILDRPNPLGGVVVDGVILDEHLSSFVGRFPIPNQHGMTLIELAEMINDQWNPFPCDLTVVPCEGWRRSMRWQDTGRIWIPTSPNMPHISTVNHYPGACLVEGTNLSEGRGTALPFEIVGAPFIDALALADQLNAKNWAGVRFRPFTFTPSLSKWAGETCQGVQVHITNLDDWRPIPIWLGVIAAIKHLYPSQFAWGKSFDILSGSESIRENIDQGNFTSNLDDFKQKREQYLIYR